MTAGVGAGVRETATAELGRHALGMDMAGKSVVVLVILGLCISGFFGTWDKDTGGAFVIPLFG
jgi:hypothetical protein